VPWAHTVAAPEFEQSAEAGEATVTAMGVTAMAIPKIRFRCLNCMAAPPLCGGPPRARCPGNAPEPLSAERKSTSVNARQIRNFKIAACCNGKEFHSWLGEFIEIPGALTQVLGRMPDRPGDAKFPL
jgi:hypothetical protein